MENGTGRLEVRGHTKWERKDPDNELPGTSEYPERNVSDGLLMANNCWKEDPSRVTHRHLPIE